MNRFIGVLALLPLALRLAPAQETRGVILGRITDTTGAVVVGAQVQSQNLASNTVVSTVTNEDGNYTIPYLLPGSYRVSVEMKGFKKGVREAIQLRTGERITIDFELEVGAATDSIVVTAEAPQLEQTTASISMTVDAKRVAELPKVGGNPYYMARLAPGIAGTTGRYAGNPFDYGSGSTDTVVDGARAGSNEVQLDGSPNMFRNSTAFALPEDLVQEMKIQTTTYDASMGHAAGALVNISMKSGANDLHGTGTYLDSHIRATPWFTNRFIYDPSTGPITPEKIARNTPGWVHQRWDATASGPLWIPKVYNGKNRTFWSFGYEGLHILRNLSFTGTVPTPEELQGDFSALLKLGANYQIYDPATIAPAPNGRFSRQPLPGNIVPASRMDPIAKKLASYWPAPNQPGTVDGRQNFFRTQDINRNNRDFVGRLDQNFSEKHRLFLRVNNNYRWELQQSWPSLANGDAPTQSGWGAVLDDVYVFNPSLLLNARYGLSFQNPRTSRYSQGMDLTTLGFSKSMIGQITAVDDPAGFAFPEVVVDGGAYTNLGANGGDSYKTLYQTLSGTVTQLKGDHSIRYGVEFRVLRETGLSFGNVAPRLEFGNGWTHGPLDTSPGAPIGQGLASMLLGYLTGGYVSVNTSRAMQSSFTGVFVQDDWKLTPRLTVNLGLRYEYESPLTERWNRSIRSFDFATPSPIDAQARLNYARSPIPEVPVSQFKAIGGLTFAGLNGQPRSLWNGDKNNFAPRIGLAYTLGKRTVIRAGYGIFYDLMGADRTSLIQSGYSQSANILASLDNGLTFISSPANPFPSGIQTPPGSSLGARTFLGRSGTSFYPNPLSPYMQRWSFTIQQELPLRTLLEIGYVGNRGAKLGVSRELDSVPRQYMSASPVRDQAAIDYLNVQVDNPFTGIADFAGTGLSGVRVGRSQLLRPLPHFSSVPLTYPAGYSYYHSLQIQAEKRFSHGFTYQAAYTHSKFMEARSYLNDTDPYLEKVISDQDYPDRFIMTGIYELPFGKGRKFAGNARGWVDGIIGGWQLQGWYEGQSGEALGFGNAIFTGNLHDIPLPVSQRRAERWFNVDAGFQRDSAKQLGSNIRTLNSRFNGVRADGTNNLDASLFKTFRVTERVRVQFRMDTFNTLNHVQFGAPNTTPNSSAFGTITGEKGHGQRQVSLGAKVLF